VVLIEGARSKQGVATALARFAHDPAGAMNELNAQFIGNRMKTLLRSQIEADLARLEQRVGGFVRQLADFVQITVL
jgi:type IV secretion system protein VirB4